eukprot:scaffold4103_cov248-Ochromonas_danica.AAC.9
MTRIESGKADHKAMEERVGMGLPEVRSKSDGTCCYQNMIRKCGVAWKSSLCSAGWLASGLVQWGGEVVGCAAGRKCKGERLL